MNANWKEIDFELERRAKEIKRLSDRVRELEAAAATPEPVEDVEAMREWQREWFKANRVTVYNNQISIDHIELMLRDFAAAQRGKPKPEIATHVALGNLLTVIQGYVDNPAYKLELLAGDAEVVRLAREVWDRNQIKCRD